MLFRQNFTQKREEPVAPRMMKNFLISFLTKLTIIISPLIDTAPWEKRVQKVWFSSSEKVQWKSFLLFQLTTSTFVVFVVTVVEDLFWDLSAET
jgi:hypothetical protein